MIARLKRGTLTLIVLCAATTTAVAAGTDKQWGPVDVLHRSIAPGEKLKFTFATQRSFEAAFLDTLVMAARGVAAGPTLCVTAVIHGDEINSFEIARRAFASVDARRLNGTFIVVPAVNAAGFRTMDRYMPDRRDLNREFPGSKGGSVARIVANALFEGVIRHCDGLIDLHTGSNYRTNVAQIRVDVDNPGALAMAEHFNAGLVVAGGGPDGSLRREAVKAGVPAIIYESGPPYVFVEKEIETGTRGVLNVLDYLGMYETTSEQPHSQRLADSWWVRVPRGHGGVFLSTAKLGDRVKEGDVLGTVADPLSDEVYEIRAERGGLVVGSALPQVVLSGYGLFHVGELAD